MHASAPARAAELPPHSLPLPRILAALATATIVAASSLVGAASPAAADGENVVPIAVDDTYSTPVGTQLVVANPGIFANDIDPDSAIELLSVDKSGIAGTVFVNNPGGFTYNPTPGFTGVTSFQYRLVDPVTSQFSDWATVSITVEPPAVPNAAPVTVPDTYTTPHETLLEVTAANGLLVNDSDADGDPIVAVSLWEPSVGVFSTYSDQGTFTYQPPLGFTGDVTFLYRAFDHTVQGDAVSVTITVLPPVAPVTITANGDAYPVTAGATFGVTTSAGVLANDLHSAGDPLTVSWFSEPGSGFSMQPDGSFSWAVPADACGIPTFSYTASDGAITSASASVSLMVLDGQGLPVDCDSPAASLNAAPVGTDDEYAADPGQSLIIPVGSGVLANDTDADGDSLTAIVVTPPSIGTGFSLEGDGSFTWTAPSDFCDEITFTYAAADAESQSEPVTVTVRPSAEKEWEQCIDDDHEEITPQPGSPTAPTIPTLPGPGDPQNPGDTPELSDQPGTPGRDTLAYTGASDLSAGIGWGALLALMLGLGLVAPHRRTGRERA